MVARIHPANQTCDPGFRDYEDRLSLFSTNTQIGPIVYTAVYDADHRRVAGRYNTFLGALEAKIEWDEEKILGTRDFNDVTVDHFDNEPGQYGPLVSQYTDGQLLAQLFDGLGSMQQTVDDSQTIVLAREYNAFGQTLSGEAGPLFNFVGQWGYQGELPFFFYIRRRYYSASLGRWLSEDEIRNLRFTEYGYASNRPTIVIDASGLAPGCFMCCMGPASDFCYQALTGCLEAVAVGAAAGELAFCIAGCAIGGPTYPECVVACTGIVGLIGAIAAAGCIVGYGACMAAAVAKCTYDCS